MVTNDNNYIIVFASHNQAAFLHSNLVKLGYKVELVSTPCKISAGCSQSIRFKLEYLDIVKQAAVKCNMKIRGIYKIIIKGSDTIYELIDK